MLKIPVMWTSVSKRCTLGLQYIDIGTIAHNQDFIVSGSHGNIAGDVGEELDEGVGDCVPLKDALIICALKVCTAWQYITLRTACSPLRAQVL